jgi:hypothetical protein
MQFKKADREGFILSAGVFQLVLNTYIWHEFLAKRHQIIFKHPKTHFFVKPFPTNKHKFSLINTKTVYSNKHK